jgi:hypothetical protein
MGVCAPYPRWRPAIGEHMRLRGRPAQLIGRVTSYLRISVRRKLHARAYLSEHGRFLQHNGAKALSGESEGGRQSANAATNDDDPTSCL